MGTIAGGTLTGVGVVSLILYTAYTLYNKYKKPTGPHLNCNVCFFNCIRGDVGQIKSTNGTDITPGNAADKPMIDVETKKEPL
jgi:hypothetical protein